MESSGKKLVKPQKTKFKKNSDTDYYNNKTKLKKHDKAARRLLRQEKEYDI